MCGSGLADEYDGELRMLRIFRLLNLDKYIPSISLILAVIANNKRKLRLSVYATGMLWLTFATLLYATERTDPETVDGIAQSYRYRSIPSALPYTIVNLTGDYPLIDYETPARCVLFVALIVAVGVVAVRVAGSALMSDLTDLIKFGNV